MQTPKPEEEQILQNSREPRQDELPPFTTTQLPFCDYDDDNFSSISQTNCTPPILLFAAPPPPIFAANISGNSSDYDYDYDPFGDLKTDYDYEVNPNVGPGEDYEYDYDTSNTTIPPCETKQIQ